MSSSPSSGRGRKTTRGRNVPLNGDPGQRMPCITSTGRGVSMQRRCVPFEGEALPDREEFYRDLQQASLDRARLGPPLE